MTLELGQTDAIETLKSIDVLPDDVDIRIVERDNEKLVVRKYSVDFSNTRFPAMDSLTVRYKIDNTTGKVKDYSVYATNNLGDTVYLCKYSPRILNTLFDNIILLELSNWRRITKKMKPLKTINDYKSLMFEINTNTKKQTTHLRKLIEKNTSQLLNKFQEYQDSDKIIPAKIWQQQVI